MREGGRGKERDGGFEWSVVFLHGLLSLSFCPFLFLGGGEGGLLGFGTMGD